MAIVVPAIGADCLWARRAAVLFVAAAVEFDLTKIRVAVRIGLVVVFGAADALWAGVRSATAAALAAAAAGVAGLDLLVP